MRFQDLGTRGVLQNLDPAIIVEDPGWNERKPGPALEAHISMLAQSIKALGVQEPLTVYVRGEEVVLVNGHCRLAAVRSLIAAGDEIRTVPVRVEPKTANEADRVLSMLTRNSGKPLEPIEMASVFSRLLAFGWTEQEIATKAGFSTVYVQGLLKLNAAPEAIKAMVRKNEVSASTAARVIRESGPEATQVLTEAVATAKESGKAKATGKHLKAKTVTPEKLIKAMRKALKAAQDWMASSGCDCGTDEPGTCALCEVNAALKLAEAPRA